MAQFYKELKELRISKEISLEDLQSKTKINIRYLEAIESGNFEELMKINGSFKSMYDMQTKGD